MYLKYFLDKTHKNFIKTISFDFFSKAIGFLTLPIYLFLMSPQDFGFFNLFLNLISTTSLVFGLNFYVGFIKSYTSVDTVKDKSTVLNTFLVIYIFLIIFLSFSLYFNFLDKIFFQLLGSSFDFFLKHKKLIYFLIISNILSTFLYSYLMSQENLNNFRIYIIIKSVATSILGIFFIYFNEKLNAAYLRLLIIVFVEGIFLFYFFLKIRTQINLEFNYKYLQESLKIGLPVTLSSITYFAFSTLDITLLDKFGSINDISNYTLALTLVSILPMLMASFQSVFTPNFFREKSISINYVRVNSIVKYLMIGLLVICILSFCVIHFLLKINFFPIQYFEIKQIIIPLLIGASGHALTHLYKLLYTQLLLNYVSFIINIVTAVLAIFLYPLLIKNYGIFGASMGNCIIGLTVLFLHAIIISILIKKTL
jgi:O-antigen/teichoic acid export membrane protein